MSRVAATIERSRRRPWRSRSVVVRGGAAAVVALLATGCGSSGDSGSKTAQQQDLKVAKIAVGPAATVQFWIDIGIEKGFYKEQGVTLEKTVTAPAAGVAAVNAGSVDFTYFAGSGTRAAVGGLPLRTLALIQTEPYSLVSKASIKSAGDVKSVGVSEVGADPSLYLEAVAKEAGVEKSHYTELAVKADADRMTALESGHLDAAIFVPPFAQQLEAKGFNILYGPQIAKLPSNGIVTAAKTLESDPDLVNAVVKGMVKTMAWTKNNPDEAAPLFAKFYNLSPEVAKLSYETQVAALNFSFSDEDYKNIIEEDLAAANKPAGSVPMDKVFNLATYRQALKDNSLG